MPKGLRRPRASTARRCSLWGALGCCLGFLAASCAPSLADNPAREPSTEVPASFGKAGRLRSADSRGQSAAQAHWNTFFGVPELQALIDTALENSQELNIRMQEIVISEAELGARRGEYLPKLGAGAGVGLDKAGTYTSEGAANEVSGVEEPVGDFAFGLYGSWEVDIWKRLRNGAKAANYRTLSSIAGRNFMVTALVAEIARAYYELLALDNELLVIEKNIAVQTNALEVVKLEKLAARVTELAVQRFEAEVLKNRSRRFDLEQQRVQTENRINFLVGRYPEPIRRSPSQFEKALPNEVQVGLPSDLLKNRPDVRQAELELAASKLDVDAARARFYPALRIDAGVGYRAFNVEHLLTTPESLVFNVAGGLTAPLLNRAAIEAEYRSANARQIQAVLSYERTLLQAFTDVANQQAMLENLQKSYELQSRQVDTLTQSVEISNVLFQSARADYMEVLLTRRDRLDAEMELIETRKRQLLAMVNLYQALGGGWRSPRKKTTK